MAVRTCIRAIGEIASAHAALALANVDFTSSRQRFAAGVGVAQIAAELASDRFGTGYRANIPPAQSPPSNPTHRRSMPKTTLRGAARLNSSHRSANVARRRYSALRDGIFTLLRPGPASTPSSPTNNNIMLDGSGTAAAVKVMRN
jgi:hypothetical protein